MRPNETRLAQLLRRRSWLERCALAMAAPLCAGCPTDPPVTPPATETLVPEPAGAPTEVADGRFTCVGKNVQPPAEGNALIALLE